MTYILFIYVVTSPYSSHTGITGHSQEFMSEKNCNNAGKALVQDIMNRGRLVISWGCFPK